MVLFVLMFFLLFSLSSRRHEDKGYLFRQSLNSLKPLTVPLTDCKIVILDKTKKREAVPEKLGLWTDKAFSLKMSWIFYF